MKPAIGPATSANVAHLRYVTDAEPGIRRRREGKCFVYVGSEGKRVRNPEHLRRIKSLAIPPAWEDVWICASKDGHLQATGRDQKGRKQYCYHPRWREVRDDTKYHRILEFGAKLPRLRRRCARDLAARGLPRKKVLAAIVSLLETTLIRVGNEEYARDNKSFGLTSMRDRHLATASGELRFEFQGKSKVAHSISVSDPRLARIVKRCHDLPGYTLFQYLDEDGQRHAIEAAHVNAYLREAMGDDFTTKDFRTWAGTVLAYKALSELREFDSQAQAKKNVITAIESVAKKLGNTKNVCRKCYIHPEIIDSYIDRSFSAVVNEKIKRTIDEKRLRREEAVVMALLRERLKREDKTFVRRRASKTTSMRARP